MRMHNWSEFDGYYIDYWRSWFYRFNASELFGKENKIVVVDDLSMEKKKTWIWRNK